MVPLAIYGTAMLVGAAQPVFGVHGRALLLQRHASDDTYRGARHAAAVAMGDAALASLSRLGALSALQL
eukprot:7068203-Pyramimonas_sp.AAC.1